MLSQVGPDLSQDAPFELILWYISKAIHTLWELDLYFSRSSSKYVYDDIYLVNVILGGIKYCNIHM